MNQHKYIVRPAAKKPIEVCVPGAKSITNRALLIAALANGRSELTGVLFSDDSRHFLQALIDLGFSVEVDEERAFVAITGLGGAIPAACRGCLEDGIDAKIDVGSAGTAARFLAAYLGMSKGRFFMTSSEQMKRRPMQELLEALALLGADIAYGEEAYHFPFVIGNEKRTRTEITIDIDKSSQFLSALLISSVLSDEDFVIHVTGSHGMAYVEMTLRMMEQFGVSVEREDAGTFRVPGAAHYQALAYEVEPDVSAAAYFYAMCPVLHVSAKVFHVHKDCLQGDIAFLRVLQQMGCRSEEEADGIRMDPPEGRMRGGSFDLSAFSDQALTLAAIGCFAELPVTIRNVGHIRYQECDRLAAIEENLARMGIACEVSGGDITILPGQPHGCEIETFEDHRVAMAFAIPGLVTPGITIVNPMCCRKTFERYFKVLEEKVCNSSGGI